MPHSTNTSTSSDRTFILADDNIQPHIDTTDSASKHPSTASLGLAVTGNGPAEDKTRLSFGLERPRASAHVEDAYASLEGKKGHHVETSLSARSSTSHAMTSRGVSYDDGARRRSQFSEEFVPVRDTFSNSARDKVLRNSPLIAELKTNVIIKDEFTLVTDLSYQLAQRYSRPEACVMIKVDHSACLALGGGFDPCYILNIGTVPSQMGPWANRRNAALIQSFMAEILSVPAHRGVVKFEAVPEECYAMNGNTVQGQLERVERMQNDEAARRGLSSPHRKSMSSFNVRRSETKPNGTIHGPENTSRVASEDFSSEQHARPKTSHGHSSDNVHVNGDGDYELNSGKERQSVNRQSHASILTNDESAPPRSSAMRSSSTTTLQERQQQRQKLLEQLHESQPMPSLQQRQSTHEKAQPQMNEPVSHPETEHKLNSQSSNSNLDQSFQSSQSHPKSGSLQPRAASRPIPPGPSPSSSSISLNTAAQSLGTNPLPASTRSRNADNLAILSKKYEDPNPTSTNPAANAAALAAASAHDSTAANTAKRRATLTSSNNASANEKTSANAAQAAAAAGVVNSSNSSPPSTASKSTSPFPPPPIPVSSSGASTYRFEVKSIRSLRLGRRGLFSVFKRGPKEEA